MVIVLVCLCGVAPVLCSLYRLPGAWASLAAFPFLPLTALMASGQSVSLPAVAGLILSALLAVDANVQVCERLRAELRAGSEVPLALEMALRKASSSLLDTHTLCFVLAAGLCLLCPTGARGFGLTLIVGTVWSLVTVMLINRTLMLWGYRRLGLTHPSLYGG